jgi:hypothetical protein
MSLCRADDPNREPRFQRAIRELGAWGCISDLDDSPAPAPLSPHLDEIKHRITGLVTCSFDLVFTHGPRGEYTRHQRHEQVHAAVRQMVEAGDLTGGLVCFAYDDCGGACRPRPDPAARIQVTLSQEEHAKKLHIVRDIYGFREGSFELDSAGAVEAFHVLSQNRSSNIKHLVESPD